LVITLFATVALAFDVTITRPLFEEFKTKYNKIYSCSDEEAHRFDIFNHNFDLVQNMNSISNNYGITKFSDLEPQEFKNLYIGERSGAAHQKKKSIHIPAAPIPTSFDWSSKGAVSPVKDQGQCGSCWAFSATEAIESAWFLYSTNHTLPILSPQQIVDCDTVDQGCNGGDTTTAYQYVMSAGGLDTEASYPYTAEDGTCAFQPKFVAAKISNWTYITNNENETEMQLGLLAKGPLSVCVDATSWQFYVLGVITDLCPSSSDSLDHCVMVTGYNEKYVNWNGLVYDIWMVRNSWGTDWGYDGYIWVERGYNLCGIADEVTIPII